MPYKNKNQKRSYNQKYHQKKLGVLGSYNTTNNITYPTYLDLPDPPYLDYTLMKGRRRVREFKNILPNLYPASQGYKIKIIKTEGRGIDVKIWKNEQLHTVMELTNYNKTSRMDKVTAKRYLKSFRRFNQVKKIIVVSYPQNIRTWDKQFIKKGIRIKIMNYQA